MPDQVSKSEKGERLQQLAQLEGRLRRDYFQSLVGRSLRVLIESPTAETGRFIGTSCRYAPVVLPASDADLGQLVDCVPTACDESSLSVGP